MYLPLLLLVAFQEPATFQSGVSLVHVDVAVTEQGRPVEGLAAADFRVLDNGESQPILHFAAEEQPLDVILLLDVSGSMEPVIASVARTAHLALGELRAGDRVAVMSFSDKTRVRTDLTADLKAAAQFLPEILDMKFERDTQLQHAVADAARHFLREPRSDRRRAVLAVTDNLGTDYEAGAVERLWEADAVLSGLIVMRPGATQRPSFARVAGITRIVEQTGGDTLNADDASTGFRELMRRLRLRYSLDYALPEAKPGEQRSIKVDVPGHPGAVVRARSGYVAPAR